MTPKTLRRAVEALDSFNVETPSWGFADTGTRFGKFFQDAAAIDMNDKLAVPDGFFDGLRRSITSARAFRSVSANRSGTNSPCAASPSRSAARRTQGIAL